MSLIDSTYFVKDINLPTGSAYTDIDSYITRYEKEILIKLLGYELWKLVDAYDPTTSDQRIKDLVEGKEWTYNDTLIKWNGFKNDDKVSLIAYYVYYWYVRNRNVNFQTTGTQKAKNENSVMASPVLSLTQAWTRLENLYQYDPESAYFFLNENSDDYPEWDFTLLKSVNGFDL